MTPKVAKNISGFRIKKFRKAKRPRITQKDLANALTVRGLKIDRVGITKIENGYRQVSDVELVAIAGILGVSPGDLLVKMSH